MTDLLPTGTVTFLFTDIEGSTQLWEQHPEAMKATLARHDALLHAAIEAQRGQVIKSTGDGLYAVFASAADAVNAVVAAQRALQAEAWPQTGPLHVRMALHTGEAELRGGDYFGPALNRTARLMAVASGGQALLSQSTASLVREQLPAQVTLRDLGEHRLKDLIRPERVYQIVAPELPADFPPLKSLGAYSHNLPEQRTPLVGRVRELAEARQLLESTRLLTLTGPGGTGKTRLALQLAADALPDCADGVYAVFLAPVRDPELVVAAIAQTLGLYQGGSQPLHEGVKEYLHERQMLLVLDNFEQVMPAAPFVAELLASSTRLKVLVTSREALHLYGEQEYPTPPLGLPDAVDGGTAGPDYVARLAQSPAVALFAQRAAAVKPGFALSAENAATVAEICIRLDGLPLAIELAAAKLKLFPPQMLLSRLTQRLALLTGGAQDLPARQRTLRDGIAWSYDLLSEGEQRFFRRLSVFSGGFTLEAAQAVGDAGDLGMDFLDALAGLVDKSLVRQLEVDSGEARFGMLGTIRDFGLVQLQNHGEGSEVRLRHCACCLDLIRGGDGYLRGPDAATWSARLDLEQDNLRAAWQWALDEARYADMAWLLVASHWYWIHGGQWYEMGKWAAQLLPHRQELESDLRLGLLIAYLVCAYNLEDSTAVGPYLEESMRAAELSSYKLLQTFPWYLAALFTPDVAEASMAFERALALARAGGEPPVLGAEFGGYADIDHVLGGCLSRYADHLIEQGEVEAAGSRATESHRILAQGNRPWRADGLGVLGRLALLRGDLARARTLLQEATGIATAVNAEGTVGRWQPHLGLVLCYEGDAGEARRLLSESLRLATEMKHKFRLAQVTAYLAEVALSEGDHKQAAQWMAQSLGHQADGRRTRLTEAERLFVAARLAAAQQEYERAATLFGLADMANSRVHNAIGGPRRALAGEALANVCAALEPEVFDEAYTAGQQMPVEQAVSIILPPGGA